MSDKKTPHQPKQPPAKKPPIIERREPNKNEPPRQKRIDPTEPWPRKNIRKDI